jgi:mRNA-degrading endonuclease RelE of RelBE toxin-antitoxin system
MAHKAHPEFWHAYRQLPDDIRDLADRNFQMLKDNPRHPSLRFRKVGDYWSARVGLDYRAVGIDVDEGILWVWIGPHDEYERFIAG